MVVSANMSTPLPVRNAQTLRPWNLPERVAFRFAFCYLALFCLGMVDILRLFIAIFGFHAEPSGILDFLWRRLVPWVAVHLMRLPSPGLDGDSDSVFAYVLTACQLFLAAGAALIWSLLDRRRIEYRVLLGWLRRTVSLLLACVLFSYGTDKVFPLQFGPVSLVRLSRRVGDLDLFNLLWMFMAGSTAYTIFSGALEILAGLVLLIPRFETLGALLSMGVMTNVLVLNMAYDVPVKLLAFHLLLCAIFLAVCNGRRIAGVLLSDRAIEARAQVPLSNRAWVNRTASIVQPTAGLAMLTLLTLVMFRTYHDRQRKAAPSPLYGIWAVDELRLTGNPPGPLLTPKLAAQMKVRPGEDRWQQLIVDSSQDSALRLGNGALDQITVKVDATGKSASLTDSADAAWKCDLRIDRPGEGLLNLGGQINGVEASVRLHRMPTEKLRLLTSHFHWVRP